MGSATTQGRTATRAGAAGRVAFRSGDGVGALIANFVAYCRRAAEAFTSEQNMLRYLRMHRICLPSEYRQLTALGLSPRQIRSLVGCSPLFTLHWTLRST